MSCENCKSNCSEPEKIETHPGPIPKYYFEQTQAKDERMARRLWIALIVSIIVFFASNAFWLWAWMQYDYTGEETVVEALDGVANYIGNDGEIVNGADSG